MFSKYKEEFMYNFVYILLSIIFYSFSYGVEVADAKGGNAVNEKFKFIKEIYSESWALIIGINKYQNVEPLHYAVNDAKSVKSMFIEKYGFKKENIIFLTDKEATKENILDGFSNILEKAGEKDRVVVFYAGHGETYKLPSGGDMGYLIPVDGDLDNLYRSSIPMKSVYDIAEMSYAKHILYLVDACYGGLTLNTRGLKKDATPEYLRKMTKERGRMVITAGGKDEQVIEKPEWGHSAFTRNLIKGLGDGLADENTDGVITSDELGVFIRNRVTIDVDGAHTPQKGRIGSDMGELVFISETLDDQIAEAFTRDEQMDALMSKFADLERKLENKEQVSKMKSASRNYIDMKVAYKKAWIFPGQGHFYSGQTGKGLLFSGLEVASLVGIAMFGSTYSSNIDAYNTAQLDYDNLTIDLSNGIAITQVDIQSVSQTLADASKAKNQALYSLVGSGISAAVIWWWNVRDIGKSNSDQASTFQPLIFGINPSGQVQVIISL